MKTDKFNESIRRKLESIQPDYQEDAWSRLQSQLPPPVVKPLWSQLLRWGLTAAAASVTAVLLASTAWLYHTNQQKTAAIETLREQVASLRRTPQPSGSQPSQTKPSVDTVYITRYVEKPVCVDAYGKTVQTEEVADNTTLPADEPAVRSETDNRAQSERERSEGNRVASEAAPSASETESAAGRRKNERYAAERLKATGNRGRSVPSEGSENRTPGTGYRSGQKATASGDGYRVPPVGSEAENVAGTGGDTRANTAPAGQVDFLESLPMRFDTASFVENYARRSRRVRYQTNTAAASRPVIQEPVPLFRFRAGASGEVGIGHSSLGISGEVLVGRYVMVGVGVNRARLTGYDSLTDADFMRKRKIDFRRDYVPGIDPRHDISNIDLKSTIWQLPVTLGYRMPVGQNVVIAPTAGATFSLLAFEQVTFTYRRGPGDFNQRLLGNYRPNSWYNTWTFSVPVEKEWDKLALQVGPFLNIPFVSNNQSFNTLTGGVRARILYRF